MITVVKGKIVAAGAVGKWKSLLRFPRAPLARLFHSFSPAHNLSFFSFLSRFFAQPFVPHELAIEQQIYVEGPTPGRSIPVSLRVTS
jgi:hypothetical protein